MRVSIDDQARACLSADKHTRHACLFQLALHTGMCQGELLGLMWKDLDWINRQIHIQRQLSHVINGSLVFSEPKTAKGRRTIVISPTMVDSLRKHLEEQGSGKKDLGEKWEENDLIFRSKLGTHLNPVNMFISSLSSLFSEFECRLFYPHYHFFLFTQILPHLNPTREQLCDPIDAAEVY